MSAPPPQLNSYLIADQNLLPKHRARTRKATRIAILRQLLTHTIVLDTTCQVLRSRLLRAARLLHVAATRALLAARFVAKRRDSAAETAGLNDAGGSGGGDGDGSRGCGGCLGGGGSGRNWLAGTGRRNRLAARRSRGL